MPEGDAAEWDNVFQQLHERNGYTLVTYFPPEAPWRVVESFMDFMTAGAFSIPREGWDAFIVGHMGDVAHVERDGHVYLSTSCTHGKHRYCADPKGSNGEVTWDKKPGECKFCSAKCICTCHVTHQDATSERIEPPR